MYDTDPKVEARRHALVATKSELAASVKVMDNETKMQGGKRLAQLETRIKQLEAAVQPPKKRPEFGYHSQISGKQDQVKWVTVDLGRSVPISQIVLHPCHDDYAGIGAGFRFALR